MELNFPSYDFKFRTKQQKKFIFDVVRKKFIPLTPEEWVRQHCIHYLRAEKKASIGLMQVEKQQKFNNLSLRFDVALFRQDGSVDCIIECKRPSVPITKETLLQAARYYQGLKPRFIWLTNGMEHVWFSFVNNKISLLPDGPEDFTNT